MAVGGIFHFYSGETIGGIKCIMQCASAVPSRGSLETFQDFRHSQINLKGSCSKQLFD